MAENNKATFGFVASATEVAENVWGDFHAELTYHDHSIGLRLKSLTVTHVWVSGCDAWFTGTCEVTVPDAPVAYPTFTVWVKDVAEPGKGADTFTIELAGFTAPGETGNYRRTNPLGGGNIQTQ